MIGLTNSGEQIFHRPMLKLHTLELLHLLIRNTLSRCILGQQQLGRTGFQALECLRNLWLLCFNTLVTACGPKYRIRKFRKAPNKLSYKRLYLSLKFGKSVLFLMKNYNPLLLLVTQYISQRRGSKEHLLHHPFYSLDSIASTWPLYFLRSSNTFRLLI